MNKKIFTIVIAALLFISSTAFGVASNRVYYQIQVVDEFMQPVTSPAITQIDIQNTSGTAVAVYTTKFGTTEVGSTGVITSGLSDGRTEFWYGDTAIDITVTDGTRAYEIESFSCTTRRFMLPRFLTSISSYSLGQTNDLDFTYASWIIDGDTANRLDMIPDNDGGILAIGDGTAQADVYIYSGGTSKYFFFDEGNELIDLVHINLDLDDNAYLRWGSDNDITSQFDGTNFELFASAADTPWAIGDTTNGFDITYYFETAGQFRTDFDGDFINLTDDMDLRFGTGASSNGDFQISSNSSNVLAIAQVVAGTGTMTIGADDTDIPTTWYAETSGDYVLLTGDDLQLEDVSLCLAESTQLQLGDPLGTGDFQISSTSNVLTIGQIVSGTGTIAIGADGKGIDTAFYGENASDNMLWDQDGVSNVGALKFTDSVAYFLDSSGAGASAILLGTGASNNGDFAIRGDSSAVLHINQVASGTGTMVIGADDKGIDLTLYAETSGDYLLWDQSDDDLKFVGTNLVLDGDSAIENPVVVVTDAAEYDVTAANSGKVHVIADLSQNTSIDLPAEASGLYYTFIYVGGADDAHDHTIDSENDTNYLIGGVAFADTDAGAGADEINAGIYSDGNSNSKLTINNASAGTIVSLYCDGTNWYVSGRIFSDTAPSFADQ